MRASPQPWLILQVFSLISESNLGLSVIAEYQVRLFREQNRKPESSRVLPPAGHPLLCWWEKRRDEGGVHIGVPSPPAVTLPFCWGPPLAQGALEGVSQAGLPSCRKILPHWSCWDQ